MLATGNDDFGTVAASSYIGRAALNGGTNWRDFIGGSYDDAQVSVSFLITVYLLTMALVLWNQWVSLSSFLIIVYLFTIILTLRNQVILALWKIADYKTARGLDASPYLVSHLHN